MGFVHGVPVERAQQRARSAEHFLLGARAREDASARHDAVGEVEGEGPQAGIVQAPGGAERRFVGDDNLGLGESCTGSRGQDGVRSDADLGGSRPLDVGLPVDQLAIV